MQNVESKMQNPVNYEGQMTIAIQRVGRWDSGTFLYQIRSNLLKTRCLRHLAPPCPPRQVAQTSGFQELYGVVRDQSSNFQAASPYQPTRIIDGPNRDRNTGFSSQFAQPRCHERMVERDLVGTKLLRKRDDMFTATQEMHYLGSEQRRSLHLGQQMLDRGNHGKLEAFDDDPRKQRRIFYHIADGFSQFEVITLPRFQLYINKAIEISKQAQDLFQSRYGLIGKFRLSSFRESMIEPRTYVDFAEIFRSQTGDTLIPRTYSFEVMIVNHDGNIVLGKPDIEFDSFAARIYRHLERRQRVLRRAGARAAMRDDQRPR